MVPKSAGGSNQWCDINRFANRDKVVRLGGLAELEQGIDQTINVLTLGVLDQSHRLRAASEGDSQWMVRLEPFLRAGQVQIAFKLGEINWAVSEGLGAIDHNKWLLILWY